MKKHSLFMYIIFIIFLIYSIFISSTNLNISSNFIYPTNFKSISSYFGNRVLYGLSNFHNGVDFLAPENSPIYAVASGNVVFASFMQDGFGNTIIIDHNNGYKSMYCHTSENFIVKVGDYVSSNNLIGYVGPKYLSNGIQNGNTTGPHLHFSILYNNTYIDPLTILLE